VKVILSPLAESISFRKLLYVKLIRNISHKKTAIEVYVGHLMELYPSIRPTEKSFVKKNKEFDWENAKAILDGVRKLSSYKCRRISHILAVSLRLRG
jgi:hypothetical protein